MSQANLLTVMGRYDQIRTLCAFVTSGAREAGMGEDDVFHIELCCDEAATNIIEHAYEAENQGEITVEYQVEGDAFTIIMHDRGEPFDPNLVPEPSVDAAESAAQGNAGSDNVVNDLRVGGLGLHIIRKLMDEVTFSFNRGIGNELVMVKRFVVAGDGG